MKAPPTLCASCGAPLGGREGCQAAFDRLSARAWEKPERGAMHNTTIDAAHVKELAALTKKGIAQFEKIDLPWAEQA